MFLLKKNLLLSLCIISICFCLDIWTKRVAFHKVDQILVKTAGVHTYIRVNDYFNIVQVINTGISFGLFDNIPYRKYILSLITIMIIIYVFYLLYNEEKNIYYNVIYSLIISGGLGNLYDRILFGGVFDFLDFHINDYHWPAFNLADSFICSAVILYIVYELFLKQKYKNTEK